jgi:hypothetical protein
MSEDTKSVKVFALQSPENNIVLEFPINPAFREEAALISFIYTLTAPRRPQPSVEPEKTIYRNLRPWKRRPVPGYVVVVEDGMLAGASVIAWDGKKSLQGDVPWGRPVVGTIKQMAEGTWFVDATDAQKAIVIQRQRETVQRALDAERAKQAPPPPVPATKVATAVPPEPEPVMAVGTPVEQTEEFEQQDYSDYHGDPFTVSADGHYVGDDGFVVPLDFDEFFERYPKYILNWVKKRINHFQIDDDVEDWTQDLIIHMKFLPAGSKYRRPGWNGRPDGCQDVIETFNPYQQYGASERRFRNYINMCLANKFNTVQGKHRKNPVCRPGNIAFGTSPDEVEQVTGSDEYIHSNSPHLQAIAERKEKQHDDRLFTNQFKRFVKKEDPAVFPAIEALEATGPLGEAAEYMGVTEAEFARYRARLKQLAECFQSAEQVPKQRKPYKKRIAVGNV